MIRAELRGARDEDLKDPLGVPERMPETHIAIMAWTDMEIWLYNILLYLINCQSPVTIKESNTLQVDSFRNVVNSEPLARIRKVLN